MKVFRKTQKAIVVFLLLNFLISALGGTIGIYASSHKSVQTANNSDTDEGVVDLKTGDYAYSLALMELPSPEGSLPIELNYHSNIHLEESASWVGLGWEINAAGAITRS